MTCPGDQADRHDNGLWSHEVRRQTTDPPPAEGHPGNSRGPGMEGQLVPDRDDFQLPAGDVYSHQGHPGLFTAGLSLANPRRWVHVVCTQTDPHCLYTDRSTLFLNRRLHCV